MAPRVKCDSQNLENLKKRQIRLPKGKGIAPVCLESVFERLGMGIMKPKIGETKDSVQNK